MVHTAASYTAVSSRHHEEHRPYNAEGETWCWRTVGFLFGAGGLVLAGLSVSALARVGSYGWDDTTSGALIAVGLVFMGVGAFCICQNCLHHAG